ncbi:hypothetical protein [Janibacter melonis]|uniref:hypothetical protein n=1 Tax=Janibacter melonis TaxID=262209 RepID=UPI00209597A7|nr:hypothetical protein [Janibacter melonis]
MDATAEEAIVRWHEVVNAADLDAARRVVTDPIVVSGPKGAGPISPDGFADWITRSGIALRPRSYHPISTRVLVVEQDARWPKNTAWTRVATVFRVTDMRVSAALRFADLRTALEFAYLYRELAATERGALMSAGV